MNRMNAIQVLRDWDKAGKYVFTKHELAKLFVENSPKTLAEGLNRLVKDDLLQRVCRGIYVNKYAKSFDSYVLERIAISLRGGDYNYLSLESMLSEYGAISQIPVDRLTVMTTGRKGVVKTPYGVIEYTHTKRSSFDIIEHIKTIENRPLRIATLETAWRDLKRVGRNTQLVDQEVLSHG